MRKGLTLVELMIAMGMSAVIFVIVSAVMMTVLNSSLRDRRQSAFEQVKNDLTSDISNSVRWSQTVTADAGQLVTDTNTYRLESGRILKNDQTVSPQTVEITEFTITDRSKTELAGLEIVVGMKSTANEALTDRLKIAVSQRKTELEVSP